MVLATISYWGTVMTHAWMETNLISKSLSKLSSNHDQMWNSTIADYVEAMTTHHTAMNVDRRATVIGNDAELHWWTMIETSVPGWEANVWSAEMRAILFEECIKATNYLWVIGVPESWMMEQMNDRSKNVTLVNDCNLYAFEKFYLTQTEVSTKYTDTEYSTLDVQDILAGTNAGTYDYVHVRMKDLVSLNSNLVDAYMNTLSVGGVMHIEDTGAYGSFYSNHSALHKHYMTKTNRSFLTKDGFMVFHLATDDGTTIIKRTS